MPQPLLNQNLASPPHSLGDRLVAARNVDTTPADGPIKSETFTGGWPPLVGTFGPATFSLVTTGIIGAGSYSGGG